MSSKTIEHYLANPDELPTDVAEIDALLANQGGETGTTDAEPEVKGDVTPASSSQTEDETTGVEPAEEAPIASKDGKHTIPYAVLATEREKRVAAERMQQELMQRLQDIETKMATGQSVVVEQQQVADLLDEQSTQDILADFPSLKPMVDYTKTLERKVAEFEQRFQQVEELEYRRLEEQAGKARDDVRREIDANPTLSFWEAKDTDRWQAAVEADQQLRNMPINQKLSMRERFEKVVAVVEAIYGPTELPPEFAPKQQPKPKLTEKVDVAPLQPKTIGELPGGMAPKADDLESLLEQSSTAIAAKLDKMTPDQIASLVARLG